MYHDKNIKSYVERQIKNIHAREERQRNKGQMKQKEIYGSLDIFLRKRQPRVSADIPVSVIFLQADRSICLRRGHLCDIADTPISVILSK